MKRSKGVRVIIAVILGAAIAVVPQKSAGLLAALVIAAAIAGIEFSPKESKEEMPLLDYVTLIITVPVVFTFNLHGLLDPLRAALAIVTFGYATANILFFAFRGKQPSSAPPDSRT